MTAKQFLETRALQIWQTWARNIPVLLLGQAGLGNVEEYGQLSLGTNDNYCMGGPGVILSKETLRQLAPYLGQCLNSLLTTHEDVELGRCISLFHNNASIANLFTNHLTASTNSHTLRHLFTLHPVKTPIAMRYIHLRVEMIKLSELRQKRIELMEQIEEIKGKNKKIVDQQPQIINSEYSASSNHNALFSGLIPKVPTSPENAPIWEFISSDTKLLYSLRYHRLRGPLHSRAPLTVRRHAYVQQRFGRAEVFDRFANNLIKIANGRRENSDIRLVLILYSSHNNEDILINSTINRLSTEIPVRLLKMPERADFNRGAALSAGIALLPPN
uniref:Hexosyltransferase n=1 Tax=Meloidogyne javanica TaxID=6303 RepID=A0A915N3F2_MELJA